MHHHRRWNRLFIYHFGRHVVRHNDRYRSVCHYDSRDFLPYAAAQPIQGGRVWCIECRVTAGIFQPWEYWRGPHFPIFHPVYTRVDGGTRYMAAAFYSQDLESIKIRYGRGGNVCFCLRHCAGSHWYVCLYLASEYRRYAKCIC